MRFALHLTTFAVYENFVIQIKYGGCHTVSPALVWVRIPVVKPGYEAKPSTRMVGSRDRMNTGAGDTVLAKYT